MRPHDGAVGHGVCGVGVVGQSISRKKLTDFFG